MVYNLWKVQERFEVDIKELPEQIDTSTYSKWCFFVLMIEGYISAVIFVFCNVTLHASCIVIVSAIVSGRPPLLQCILTVLQLRRIEQDSESAVWGWLLLELCDLEDLFCLLCTLKKAVRMMICILRQCCLFGSCRPT